jgi:hypothetical protein
MKTHLAFLSAVLAIPLMFAATDAVAALDADAPGVTSAATVGPGPWLVRAEASLVDMRDNWLNMPGPEVGLTVGRELTSRLSLELTGSARTPDSAQRRSWSALAAARGVVVANRTGRHALTVAGGPFFEIGHPVHGSMPFAHAELAYVYRSSFGLTVLAGGGANIALATSRYVEPPPTSCPDSSGDAFVWCLDFGPDAREIHAGDRTAHVRLAVGWQF